MERLQKNIQYVFGGCLVASVVFYTIGGMIVAVSPSSVETYQKSGLSEKGAKIMDEAPSTLKEIQMTAKVMPS